VVNNRQADEWVTVGHIAAVYGVKGWVKIRSYTEPLENVMHYQPWRLVNNKQTVIVEIDTFKHHAAGLVAHIVGCDDRDKAKLYTGLEIRVERSLLPKPKKGEFYWYQLEGLTVVTDTGVTLGKVDYLIETGSNDVLVVNGEDRERLIPYLPGSVIKSIDLEAAMMTVDWDPEF
jgi:16S rRNA processing protein RimM